MSKNELHRSGEHRRCGFANGARELQNSADDKGMQKGGTGISSRTSQRGISYSFIVFSRISAASDTARLRKIQAPR